MAAVAINKPTPQSDPLRLELAAALAARQQKAEELAAHRRAADSAFDELAAAEVRLEAARVDIDKAGAADIEDAAQSIKSKGSVGAACATQKAGSALVDAENEMEICCEALARIEASQAQCEIALLWARNGVIAAVSRVLEPIATRLFAEIRELRVHLAVDQSLLGALLSSSYEDVPYFPERTGMAGRAIDAREAPLKMLRNDAQRFLLTRLGDAAEERRAVEAMLALWRPALCALRENADAPLPRLEPF